jgi:hypothetical protein
MRSDIVKKFVAMIEAEVQDRPSPAEFEMAYQARVAMDRIRFAIKVTEMSTERCEPLKEAGMQLLDALDRLESAERRFQDRWRASSHSKPRNPDLGVRATNGTARAASGDVYAELPDRI